MLVHFFLCSHWFSSYRRPVEERSSEVVWGNSERVKIRFNYAIIHTGSAGEKTSLNCIVTCR